MYSCRALCFTWGGDTNFDDLPGNRPVNTPHINGPVRLEHDEQGRLAMDRNRNRVPARHWVKTVEPAICTLQQPFWPMGSQTWSRRIDAVQAPGMNHK